MRIFPDELGQNQKPPPPPDSLLTIALKSGHQLIGILHPLGALVLKNWIDNE